MNGIPFNLFNSNNKKLLSIEKTNVYKYKKNAEFTITTIILFHKLYLTFLVSL